jgi:integrase
MVTGKPRKSVSEAIALYRRARPDLGASSLFHLRRFEADMGTRWLAGMSQTVMRNYVMDTWGHSTSTLRRASNTVLGALNHAAEHGWCDPVSIRRPADGPERSRFLSEDEETAILLEAPEYIWPALLFMLTTGARVGETTVLQWRDVVDRGDGTFHVVLRSRKGTGVWRERTVPLSPRAMQAVREQARLNSQGHVSVSGRRGPVFRTYHGAARSCAGSLSTQFRKAARKAGINDVTVHDLRRTFASRMAMRGVSMRTIADLLGHSGLGMLTRYAQMAPGAKEVAVLAV